MKDTGLYQQLLDLKFPWHVGRVELDVKAKRVDVYLEHVDNVSWICPLCHHIRGLYDHSTERVWRHLDTCQYPTFVHARLPRGSCPLDGVTQVSAPWAEGNSAFSVLFERRVIDLLQACDTQAAATLSLLSWDRAWSILEKAVARGLSRKPHRIPPRSGIDEKSFAKRHRYETVVGDLDQGPVEYVADDRTEQSLAGYYQQFTAEELAQVEAVAMDMGDPFYQATLKAIPNAEQKIVFDRFHVLGYLTKAVDTVRRQEHHELEKKDQDLLKGTRFLWLMHVENVPEGRWEQFDHLRALDLNVARASALKANARRLWTYRTPGWAQRFFKRGYFWATHSRLKPMIAAAKTLKNHLANIITSTEHHITNAVAEGLNSKIEKVKKMACGFRNREHYRIAILFHCGGLDLYPRVIKP